MLRIRALNEDSNSSGPEEHEPEVTKEAQVSYLESYLPAKSHAPVTVSQFTGNRVVT